MEDVVLDLYLSNFQRKMNFKGVLLNDRCNNIFSTQYGGHSWLYKCNLGQIYSHFESNVEENAM